MQAKGTISSRLEIRGLRKRVRVGCTEAERATRPRVLIDAIIGFDAVPKACESDMLSDSICYAEICDAIDKVCATVEVALIERLAKMIFDAVIKMLPSDSRLQISILKEDSPVPDLTVGARFEYGNLK